jgi:DNA-directed RNA polymerase specialized sigma24 family protein
MKQLCGMSHQEIAAVLGRSEPACRMLLRRGMVQLARELELLGGGG